MTEGFISNEEETVINWNVTDGQVTIEGYEPLSKDYDRFLMIVDHDDASWTTFPIYEDFMWKSDAITLAVIVAICASAVTSAIAVGLHFVWRHKHDKRTKSDLYSKKTVKTDKDNEDE